MFRDDPKDKTLDAEGKKRPKVEAEFLFLQIGENLLEFVSREGRGWWREEVYDKEKETTDVAEPWRRQ